MKKRTLTDKAMFDNNQTFIDYFERLKLLAMSIFEWEGLDDVCGIGAANLLEHALFEEGRAVFIYDPELGYMTLRVNPSSKLNVYLLPEKVMAYSIGYNKNFDFDEVVYIMNNKMQRPTYNTIRLFTEKLYELDRTIMVNIKAQKTPILLQGSDKQRLTLENLYMHYDGNIPFVFGDKDTSLGNLLTAIKTEAPLIADKLQDIKHDIWNECLTYLGIDNANTDKKERLVTDEVESNNELISYYLACFYETRKKACDDINNKFFDGQEIIKLKVNKNIRDLLDMPELEKEGEENE